MDLPKELRKWINTAINQRSFLMNQGLSKKNGLKMAENIEYLRRCLDYFPYKTDRHISIFFQQNKDRILELLPGEGSSGYEKRLAEFREYDHATYKITQVAIPRGVMSRAALT